MSVITSANKAQGKAVKSFEFNPVVETAKNKPEPADPAKAKADKMAQLQGQLQSLDKVERDQLLNRLFADDLKQIVKLEQQKGFDQGLQEAKSQWQKRELELRNTIEQERQKSQTELQQMIATFADKQPVVELADESILVDIVYSAVLKIIDVQLAESDYVRDVIRTLADEFSGQETLELCLCSRDMHILSELNLQSLLGANMKVVEEDTLLPGSYRIHIEGGAIESKLDEKLKNFKTLLLETYSRRNEGV